jgi:8-oxo-dGTP pyrophosphatase MutT (NUDIX family)
MSPTESLGVSSVPTPMIATDDSLESSSALEGRTRYDGLILPPEPVRAWFTDKIGECFDADFVTGVILAGSQVTGTSHSRSNVDLIAFVTDFNEPILQRLRDIKIEISHLTGLSVSLNVHRESEASARLQRWGLFTHRNRASVFILQAKLASITVAGTNPLSNNIEPLPKVIREEVIRVISSFAYDARKFALEPRLAPHGDAEFLRLPLIALEYAAAFYGCIALGHRNALDFLTGRNLLASQDAYRLDRCSQLKRGRIDGAISDDDRVWCERFLYSLWSQLVDDFWRKGVSNVRWDGSAPRIHWDLRLPQCASMIVVHIKDRVLLAKRPRNDYLYPGMWTIPGGYVEPNETPGDAAHRELKEEVGLSGTCTPFRSDPIVSDRLAALVFEYDLDSNPGPARRLEHEEFAYHSIEELSRTALTPEAELALQAWKGWSGRVA